MLSIQLQRRHAMAKGNNAHLTHGKRCKIEAYLSSGLSQRAIAREMKIASSTICREIQRNGELDGSYDADRAQQRAEDRRTAASERPRKVTPRHLDYIYDRLVEDWSPDVIAHKTHDTSLKLSTPWIYELLRRQVRDGDDDWRSLLLRKFRKRRGPKKGGGAAHLIPNRTDIEQRPAEVDTRESFGHWEGDTIIGADHRGAIVTLVERQTRYLCCRAVQRKTKRAVANAIIAMMQPLADTVKTITFDNGGEFADHERIARHLDCDIYFAKPYHSWERGTNENLNGELRRYYPKNEPLDRVEKDELAKVERQINHRYRKKLDYSNAIERFAQEQTRQPA